MIVSPLPMRAGVCASRLCLPVGQWPDLLAFFCAYFPAVTPSTWARRLQAGEVLDAAGAVLSAHSPYRAGKQIFYYRELFDERAVPFFETVLYRDEHILIADKPHFLAVAPSGRFLHETLLVRLRNRLSLEHLAPAHRIDRATAGLLLFSLNPKTRALYPALFRARHVQKIYEAIAPALPLVRFPYTHRSRLEEDAQFFRTREAVGAENSETQIDVIEKQGDVWRYQLMPVTGRKHQLRVHMAALGAPIINDDFYPHAQPLAEDDFERPLKLLAKSLAFIDPVSGESRFFESRQMLSWSI